MLFPQRFWNAPGRLVLVLALGCSGAPERSVAVYPVDGRLQVAGQPPAGAIVTFHPIPPGDAAAPCTAVVRPDGRFAPVQPDGALGLPEGSYRLTAVWLDGDRDRFGGRHADPANPLAEVAVRPGFNLVPPIELP